MLTVGIICQIHLHRHYDDVIMGAMVSQLTSRLTIVYSNVYSSADQRKHQSSASLAFVRGIHWGPVNSPHKGPVTRKMFLFDDVIMYVWISCSKAVILFLFWRVWASITTFWSTLLSTCLILNTMTTVVQVKLWIVFSWKKLFDILLK